ncbi:MULTISPECIES: cold-shock protein [Mesorhizobium]|uniref:cold-shock protein n=1 Tax=Mesorhizobium TaxID=68287 RepID=UPI003D316BE6
MKWFNASKGFGFVALADGADAYLHMRVVEAAGCRSGAHLKVILEERPKGVSDASRHLSRSRAARVWRSVVSRGAGSVHCGSS